MSKPKWNFTDSDLPVGVRTFDTTFDQVVSTAADWTGSRVVASGFIGPDGETVSDPWDGPWIPSAKGFGYGQLTHQTYNLLRVHFKGSVIPAVLSDQADVPISTITRLVLVLDRECNNADADGSAIFTAFGTGAVHSLLAQGTGASGRFLLLRDLVLVHDSVCAATDGVNTMSVVQTGSNFELDFTWCPPYLVHVRALAEAPSVLNLSNANLLFIACTTSGTKQLAGCCRAYYSEEAW